MAYHLSSNHVTIAALKFPFAIFVCTLALPAWADSLVLRDGKAVQGKIELFASSLKIDGQTIALSDIQSAKFDQPPVPAPKTELEKLTAGMWAVEHAGALCWDGSFIARKVEAADDTKVSFENSPPDIFLSTVNTAAIFFGKISLGQADALRKAGKPGVLLANGDFVEGSFKQVADGAVTLDSVLFGRRAFALGTEAAVLWLRRPEPAKRRVSIRLRDGSWLRVKPPTLRDAALVVDGSPFRGLKIARQDLVEISNDDAPDMLTAAWARIDAAPLEKRPMLLANVESVDRSLQVQHLLKVKRAELVEARKLLSVAEVNRRAMMVQRGRFRQNWNQAQNVWRQRNREFFRLRGDGLRMNAQARTSLKNLERHEKAVNSAEKEIETQKKKRADLDRKLARVKANANDKLADKYRSQRAEVERALNRAVKALDRARAKRDRAKVAHERKFPALRPAQREAEAKRLLDEAKRKSDAARLENTKALAQWRKSLAGWPQRRQQVNKLQAEITALEIERESLLPRIPEIDPPRIIPPR